MGFYETILGMAVIPSFIIILALLANGTGRRQLNKVILTVIGIELSISGYHIKLISLMTIINVILVFACLARIHRLNVLHSNEDEHHHNMDPFHKVEFVKELYVTYRTMLMNICSVVLTICLSVATSQYEIYKPIKDQADRLQKQ